MESEIGLTVDEHMNAMGGVKARSLRSSGIISYVLRIKTLLMFIAVFLVWLAAMQFVAAEKYEIAVNVTAGNAEESTDAAAEGLYYGSLPKGESSVRYISIINNGDRDASIRIFKWGKSADWLDLNQNDFTLQAGRSERIELILQVPDDAEEGRYTGRIMVFKIPEIF